MTARFVASVMLGLLVLGLWVAPTSAHTSLLQTSPTIGQAAGGTIDFVDLAFAEPVSEAVVTVTFDGQVVPGTTTVAEGQIIRFEFDGPIETPGQYTVQYSLISFDLDETESIFFFVYDPDAAQPPRLGLASADSDSSGPNWTQIIASAALAASLAGLLGLFVTRLDAKRRRAETGDQPSAR